MTVMEAGYQTPSGKLGLYLLSHANKRAKRKEEIARTRKLPLLIVRVVIQLAGFLMLTLAGFHISFVAGAVTAGLSCFCISWLLTNMNIPSDPNTPPSTLNSPHRR